MHWIANFLGTLVDEAVLEESRERSAYIEWFASSYPGVAATAKDVARVVLETGFDTPETMFLALSRALSIIGDGDGVIAAPVYPSDFGRRGQ